MGSQSCFDHDASLFKCRGGGVFERFDNNEGARAFELQLCLAGRSQELRGQQPVLILDRSCQLNLGQQLPGFDGFFLRSPFLRLIPLDSMAFGAKRSVSASGGDRSFAVLCLALPPQTNLSFARLTLAGLAQRHRKPAQAAALVGLAQRPVSTGLGLHKRHRLRHNGRLW